MASRSLITQSSLSPDTPPLDAAPPSHHGMSLSPPTSPIDSLALAETLVNGRISPGIIVLDPSLHLLYMNHEARTMTGGMNRTLSGQKANGVLPPVIASFGEEILKLARLHSGPKDWEQVQLRKVTGNGKHFLLLRGFAVSSTVDRQEAHLLIMIEEITGRRELSAEGAKERFRFTDRENTIIIYLLRGLTNKEIANRLMVSEQTVKEHLKHIMQKTQATTRTGVLAQILLTPAGIPHAVRQAAAKRQVVEGP